ncbi:MAG TPA: glycoside hydrolase family 2 protein [Acidimicrobiales bacterium]|nr:glycoside hydrolase family 2 protein [Acidimicrobiales bacterium]
MKQSLHDGWTVAPLDGPVPDHVRDLRIPALVPGCVTTDLLMAGLVPDPYLDDNEREVAWIGRTRWSFRTTFGADAPAPGERVDLVCEGLDTVAEVRLNGLAIGESANMHHAVRFDTRTALVAGQNQLEIVFDAPVDAAERMSEVLGPRPNNSAHPFNAIRKMACNFGWDWGPDLPTAGIWRPIWLHRWKVARIAAVRPLVSLIGIDGPGASAPWADASSPRQADAHVDFHIELDRADPGGPPLAVEAKIAGLTARAGVGPGRHSFTLRVPVQGAKLWWPSGYGDQPLYEASVGVSLSEGDYAGGAGGTGDKGGSTAAGAAELDRWEGRVGFRSVSLDTTLEEGGGRRLGIVVNGRTVLARGANWIPDDCFPSRVTRARYRRQLELALGAHCNLVRVWGGGIYESEDFYDVADELGILVWQDFMLACAAYAEEEPLRSSLEAEARAAVSRLSAHPSVAVWSGGNECLWLHDEWAWEGQLAGRTWGPWYYFDLFPRIMDELDPTRPYMPGSPWSFDGAIFANDPRYGSTHVWDVWNRKDYAAYRDVRPQFVAEFGFQGPPAWSTLVRAISTRPLTAGAPLMAAHEKAADGMAKLSRGLAAHFPEPRTFADWHWAMSLNQARAISLAVQYWRSLTPRCRGTIVWQLNDCWPVISWSAIDGDGRLKPMWYALRDAYADRLLTVQPSQEGRQGAPQQAMAGLRATAVNDSLLPWDVEIDVRRLNFSGEVLASESRELTAQPGQALSTDISPEVWRPSDPARELLAASSPGHRSLWFYAEDKDIELPAPDYDAEVQPSGDGFDITLRANALLRDVAVLADRLDPAAVCDDMLFTLLPGESRRVHVRSAALAAPRALLGPEVLRCANQLSAGS